MSQLQTAAGIVGSILLGASIFLITGQDKAEAKPSRRKTDKRVEEMAQELAGAWAAYHTP